MCLRGLNENDNIGVSKMIHLKRLLYGSALLIPPAYIYLLGRFTEVICVITAVYAIYAVGCLFLNSNGSSK